MLGLKTVAPALLRELDICGKLSGKAVEVAGRFHSET